MLKCVLAIWFMGFLSAVSKGLRGIQLAKLMSRMPAAVQSLLADSTQIVAGIISSSGESGDLLVRTKSFQIKNAVWKRGEVVRIALVDKQEYSGILKAYHEMLASDVPNSWIISPSSPVELPRRVAFAGMKPMDEKRKALAA